MNPIRKAQASDLVRIAEIEIFNYRLNFYPIFRDDPFYFGELQVPRLMERYKNASDSFFVYDDGVVKGFVQVCGSEVRKLFVEPVLQSHGIGAKLIEYAVTQLHANTLWALEKNERAIAFYERHGFHRTDDRKFEEDTDEYLVRMRL
ncbi:MAG: GNAT family N-acetyltransferase [Clostridia bacterium]|nr:GNAT family N-acetyltransferase [Clostridia bacterium]